jgi:hypothetical protein
VGGRREGRRSGGLDEAAEEYGARLMEVHDTRTVWMRQSWGEDEEEEEKGVLVILLVQKRGKGGESLIVKQFVSPVSSFERQTNWVSNRVRSSNWVSYFEISPNK